MWTIRNGRRARSAVLVFLGVCLLLFGPARVWAQGEDTSLLDQLAALQARVVVLEDQLASQHVAGLTTEERCGIGIHQTLRDETVLAYKNAYGEWPRMDLLTMRGVEYAPETGNILIFYEAFIDSRWVTEEWHGCTFMGASDWWED